MLVLVGAAAIAAGRAAACSCVGADPRTALRRSDAAFVGVVVSRRTAEGVGSSGAPAVYTLRVENSVKGELGETVEVETAVSGASCGLEARVGDRVGLLLYRSAGAWTSSLCSQLDPDVLLEAARPLPVPDGTGPARFVVGGRFGPARAVVLDGAGRTLAYGIGEGDVVALARCPGAGRVAELVDEAGPRPLDGPGAFLVAVRDVRSGRLLWERRVRPTNLQPRGLACTGRMVHVFVTSVGTTPTPTSRVLAVRPTGIRVVSRGSAWECGFGRGQAFLTEGRRLVTVPLGGGDATLVARVPLGAGPFVPSPDGRWLAGPAFGASHRSRIVLVDRRRPLHVRTVPLERGNVSGQIAWLDPRRFAFLPGRGDAADARVYDTSLRLSGRFAGWDAFDSAVEGRIAYGVRGGDLISARLPSGPVSVMRRLPGPLTRALEAVPVAAADRPGDSDEGVSSAWLAIPGALLAGFVFLGLRRRRR